mgnify:CR=1 FL=1
MVQSRPSYQKASRARGVRTEGGKSCWAESRAWGLAGGSKWRAGRPRRLAEMSCGGEWGARFLVRILCSPSDGESGGKVGELDVRELGRARRESGAGRPSVVSESS